MKPSVEINGVKNAKLIQVFNDRHCRFGRVYIPRGGRAA